eukprot:2101723-Ditylum_brightwellii.AAC.1
MFFYNLELDKESQELCTIVTPYGKFQYCRLAMGLKVVPDEAQAMIVEILTGLDVEAYIDDIGIFSNDFNEHCWRAPEAPTDTDYCEPLVSLNYKLLLFST